jgi:hypothetical protein
MSENKTKEQRLTDDEISAAIAHNVDEILTVQSERQEPAHWDKTAHVSLIVRLAVDAGLPATAKNDFAQYLAESGVGGNQSQFLQSKYLKDKLPKHATRKQLVEAY